MGRFYNKKKNLIALPDNDEDEIYAGDYFPRRFPSDNLSLEYLNFYQRQAAEKTIALVTGIYETEKSADSALTVLHKPEKKVFKIKSLRVLHRGEYWLAPARQISYLHSFVKRSTETVGGTLTDSDFGDSHLIRHRSIQQQQIFEKHNRCTSLNKYECMCRL